MLNTTPGGRRAARKDARTGRLRRSAADSLPSLPEPAPTRKRRPPFLLTALLTALGALLLGRRLLGTRRTTAGRHARALIENLRDSTFVDGRGAVRSVQAADLTLGADDLRAIWTPSHLERLARTYWRFLTRVTFGLIRVRYSEDGRAVVLVAEPLRLLTFQAPEYEMDNDRGVVRWRIERGLLVARKGRHGGGYLQIEVSRGPAAEPGQALLHVEVEVANFYPSIASGISLRLYNATQSRIHVIVTYGFLRSLARLDLAESRVGALAGGVPAPGGTGSRS